MVTVDEVKCGTCGRCVAFCPREALSVTARWGHWYIDQGRCTDCFGGSYHFEETTPIDKDVLLDHSRTRWRRLCIDNCPVGAIRVLEEPSD